MFIFSGSGEGAPDGLGAEVTLKSMGARRKATMSRRTWDVAGRAGEEGDRHEEGVHPEEEEVMTGIVMDRCMMGLPQRVVSAPRPFRGWTWHLFPPVSVHGKMDREQETTESPRGPMEGAPLRMAEVTVLLVGVDEAVGVEGLDLDRS